MISGHGQKHTNHPDRPIRTPYSAISLDDVRRMAEAPASVPKEQAQWMIPHDDSGPYGRSKEHLMQSDTQWAALWADIDKGDHPLDAVRAVCNGHAAIIYSSRGATPKNKKWRIILPLARAVGGREFEYNQRILNDIIEEAGITPDRKTETCQQLCYLPNRGDHYEYAINSGALYNPITPPAPEPAPPPPEIHPQSTGDKYLTSAVLGKLNDARARLEACPDGGKHAALLREGQLVGGLLHFGVFSAGDAEGVLLSAIAGRCKSVPAARKTLRGALRHGAQSPILEEEITANRKSTRGMDELSGDVTFIPKTDFSDYMEPTAPQQPPKSAAVGLPMWSFADALSRAKAPTWLIKDVLPDNGHVAMIAPPAHGKSFIALDLAAHISCGRAWHGHKTRKVPVLYLASEGGHGMPNRIAALARAGFAPDECDITIIPCPVNLFTMEKIPALVEGLGGRTFGLMIIDTMHRSCAGMDENSSRDFGVALGNCEKLRELIGHPVPLWVHHTGHGAKDRGRGTSSMFGTWETEYVLSRDDDGGPVTLKNTKQKEAALFADMECRLAVVGLGFYDEDGVEITSCTVQISTETTAKKIGSTNDIVLTTFRELGGNNIPFTEAKNAYLDNRAGTGKKPTLSRAFTRGVESLVKSCHLTKNKDNTYTCVDVPEGFLGR